MIHEVSKIPSNRSIIYMCVKDNDRIPMCTFTYKDAGLEKRVVELISSKKLFIIGLIKTCFRSKDC